MEGRKGIGWGFFLGGWGIGDLGLGLIDFSSFISQRYHT